MPEARLKVIGGKHDGRLLPLDEDKFVVGREEDCHLRLNSRSVSRHHCVFVVDEFMVRLRDLGSKNGTFVNGKRLRSGTQLETTDRIAIGKFNFQVLIEKSPKADQPAEISHEKQLSGKMKSLSLTGSNFEMPDVGNSTLLNIPALSDSEAPGMTADSVPAPPLNLPDPSTTGVASQESSGVDQSSGD